MAQASFFVNNVKIVQAEDGFIIEGQRTCMGGNSIDRIHILMPNELKAAFREWLDDEKSPATPETSRRISGRFSEN